MTLYRGVTVGRILDYASAEAATDRQKLYGEIRVLKEKLNSANEKIVLLESLVESLKMNKGEQP